MSTSSTYVDLYWLPLGAGGVRCVRWSGRLFESLAARHENRSACDLYHSALEVRVGRDRFVVEMAPVWHTAESGRGVVGEGPVGLPVLGHSRMFRYEVRRWPEGTIPDVAEAVASPQRRSTDAMQARLLLDLVPAFPTMTWGRDELRSGDMWNSNSLISWLLTRSGHRLDTVGPPAGGRAPGWSAGLIVAARETNRARPGAKRATAAAR
jgi:hypothetical protein